MWENEIRLVDTTWLFSGVFASDSRCGTWRVLLTDMGYILLFKPTQKVETFWSYTQIVDLHISKIGLISQKTIVKTVYSSG